jgi:hypothetical protein
MNECDTCGQDDANCKCYLNEIENRVMFLEAELDKLTDVVDKMDDYLLQKAVKEISDNHRKIIDDWCIENKMNWIKVSERLPPNNHYVLVIIYDDRPKVKMNFIQIAERMNDSWYDDYNGESILDKGRTVTHWMSLPDMPKEPNE